MEIQSQKNCPRTRRLLFPGEAGNLLLLTGSERSYNLV